MTRPTPQTSHFPPVNSAQAKQWASELGFVACGITSLEPIPHADHLDRWLKSGYAGNMRYLHRQARKRKDPRLADREASRAIIVLDCYYYRDDGSSPSQLTQSALPAPPGEHEQHRVKIARYARGADYHRVTLARLEVLASHLLAAGAVTARPYVDTGPVQERELAQRAGLGWIGKNTMLIRPGLGSWFFIGCVLTDLPLEIDPPFTTDHCGTCTRCLDACPTGAFVEPRVLDATRCISYLTIEHKAAIAPELAGRMQGWAFGCDICNEVCPWNERFAADSPVPQFQPRDDPDTADPGCFATITEGEFTASFGDTPLARPGLARMRRNWDAAFASLRR